MIVVRESNIIISTIVLIYHSHFSRSSMSPEFLFSNKFTFFLFLFSLLPHDLSYDRDQPFTFQLGAGQVIKGWDQGLLDMCVGEFKWKNIFLKNFSWQISWILGEKRKLTIPPSLGYGDRGAGNVIPGGATLFFDVELINIGDSPPTTNVFKEIDDNKDKQLSRDEVN